MLRTTLRLLGAQSRSSLRNPQITYMAAEQGQTSLANGHGASALRVGIIGAGGNTKGHHIPKLQGIPDVSVVSVANRSLASAEKVCQELNIDKAVDGWRHIIDDPEINAVVIGTWPYLHRTLVIAALEAGKHVLTEARLAMNSAEAREMLRASQQRPHLVAQVVPSPVTFKYDATIQDIITSGKLGELIHIEVQSVTGGFAEEEGAPMTWRQDQRMSGNNIMSMGIFYEPLQRWVGDAVSVTALGRTVVKRRTDVATGEPIAVHVPDHLNVLAEFAIGAQGHLQVSSVLGATPRSSFTIHGREGTLHLDLVASKLTLALRKDGGKFQEIQVRPDKEYSWRVEEEFVSSIRQGTPVRRTNFTDGVRYMEFTDAVTLSMQQQRTVKLPLIS